MPQPNRKVEVELDVQTRKELELLIRSETAPARKVRIARVLLLADEDRREGRNPDWYISQQTGVSERQVCRIRQSFRGQGIVPTLDRKRRQTPGTPLKLDAQAEARLVTLCCSTPPAGHQRWTLQLLVEECCRMQIVASVCRETVRRTLKKIASSRGGRSGSAFRKKTAPVSWLTWNNSSTSMPKRTTRRTR